MKEIKYSTTARVLESWETLRRRKSDAFEEEIGGIIMTK